jgi:hypothetical protein
LLNAIHVVASIAVPCCLLFVSCLLFLLFCIFVPYFLSFSYT